MTVSGKGIMELIMITTGKPNGEPRDGDFTFFGVFLVGLGSLLPFSSFHFTKDFTDDEERAQRRYAYHFSDGGTLSAITRSFMACQHFFHVGGLHGAWVCVDGNLLLVSASGAPGGSAG